MENQGLQTVLTSVNDAYLPMIEHQLEARSIDFTEYQRKCVMNAIGAINEILDSKGIQWNSPEIDKSNITQILLEVASLELNCVAQPRECYFTMSNVKKEVKLKDKDTGEIKTQTIWQKKLPREMSWDWERSCPMTRA